MFTTSFGHSIRRHQHCINLRSHLGSAAAFVLNQLQKYNIRNSYPLLGTLREFLRRTRPLSRALAKGGYLVKKHEKHQKLEC